MVPGYSFKRFQSKPLFIITKQPTSYFTINRVLNQFLKKVLLI